MGLSFWVAEKVEDIITKLYQGDMHLQDNDQNISHKDVKAQSHVVEL